MTLVDMPDAEINQVTDSRVLAAMAHPLRRRLLNLLKVDGPSTASVLSERTGQAVGNISHHLRSLAAADLIEEAPEMARDRRERWWRRTPGALRWTSADFAGDEATRAIARAAESLNLDTQLGSLRAWSAAPDEERARWPKGPFSVDSWLRLDDEELAEFSAQLLALIRRWADREAPEDGRDRGPVFVFAHGIPARP
jgi:DNA-binding transcriptional ArsR family regulator